MQNVKAEVNTLIEDLVRTTGVSRLFLEKARPSLEMLFRDVSPEKRGQCLEFIWQIVESQASTEKTMHNVRDSLKLHESHMRSLKIHLIKLHKNMDVLRSAVQSSLLSLCFRSGGYGTRNGDA